MSARRGRYLVTASAALGGLVLFAYAVHRAGAAEIAAGIRRVGWGLLPILGLAGLRFLLRAESWRLCMPPAARVPLHRAFYAYLAGDAIGNLTPLGLAASEPAKVFLTRHLLATRESVSSLAIDILVYSCSVAVLIAVGIVVMLATVTLPFGGREAAIAGLIAVAGGVVVVWRLMRGTWQGKGPRPAWRERLSTLRESVLQFSSGHPERLWRVFLLHMLFHAVAVGELFLTLRWLLGDRSPTLAQAVILSALDRALTVAFKFVPFRLGVDEASSGPVAAMLGLGPVVGVTAAVVRKVRNIIWTGVGLLLIAAHPAPAVPAKDPL
jgi:glycosyltransferase 2 family protein